MNLRQERIITEAQIIKTAVIETMNTAQTWELIRNCAEVLLKVRRMEKDLINETMLLNQQGNISMESV